jgi:hypothetical protein
MRDVAFKQAKVNPSLSGILPDDFITEWTYVDLHPPGTLTVDDGWQFAKEADFTPVFERNSIKLALHRDEAKVLEAETKQEAAAAIVAADQKIEIQPVLTPPVLDGETK